MTTELLAQHRQHKERQFRIKAAAAKSAPHKPLPPIEKPLPPLPDKIIEITVPLGISSTIDLVVSEVCAHYNVRADNLLSHRRIGGIILPRQMVSYLLYRVTKFTTKQIAARLDRDPTTIGYAINKIEKELETHAETVKLLEDRINERLSKRKTVFVT